MIHSHDLGFGSFLWLIIWSNPLILSLRNLLRAHSLWLWNSYYYHSPICWALLHIHSLKTWPLGLSFFSTLCLDIILGNFNVHESDILSLYVLNHLNSYNLLHFTWAPHGHGQPWDLPILQIILNQKSSTLWIWTFWPSALSHPYASSYHVLQKRKLLEHFFPCSHSGSCPHFPIHVSLNSQYFLCICSFLQNPNPGSIPQFVFFPLILG